jgi:NAD(P)-dependent dehydrogenase (short-subunit alcohol dehydrogenase family)
VRWSPEDCSGIGGAIVRCLLSVGAGVVAVARNPVEEGQVNGASI